MGRKRTVNTTLPSRLAAIRRGAKVHYYYDQGTRAEKRFLPLGGDYLTAIRMWAEHEQGSAKLLAGALTTFAQVATRYRAEVIPMKAPRTQKDNEAELKNLLQFFGDGPLSKIDPIHVRQYREWRASAPIRANREIALFSHIWNMAREWGATDRENPCAGVRRNKETGRTEYVTDAEYRAILAVAADTLADAMELAYLTGQRPGDVIKMRETDVRDGCLEVRQGKTGAPLRIAITPALAAVIARCKSRKSGRSVYSTALVVGEHGQPVTVNWLRQLWETARKSAGIERRIQFRDLRAKAVSDVEDHTDIRAAQALAGHTTVGMTEQYSRARRGRKVEPTK